MNIEEKLKNELIYSTDFILKGNSGKTVDIEIKYLESIEGVNNLEFNCLIYDESGFSSGLGVIRK